MGSITILSERSITLKCEECRKEVNGTFDPRYDVIDIKPCDFCLSNREDTGYQKGKEENQS